MSWSGEMLTHKEKQQLLAINDIVNQLAEAQLWAATYAKNIRVSSGTVSAGLADNAVREFRKSKNKNYE